MRKKKGKRENNEVNNDGKRRTGKSTTLATYHSLRIVSSFIFTSTQATTRQKKVKERNGASDRSSECKVNQLFMANHLNKTIYLVLHYHFISNCVFVCYLEK